MVTHTVGTDVVDATLAVWYQRVAERRSGSPEEHVTALLTAALPRIREQILTEVALAAESILPNQEYRDLMTLLHGSDES